MAENEQKGRKASKGLGAGLGALLGDASIEREAGNFVMLPISQVEPEPNQPRKSFDEVAINELAMSIERYGVLQPITVRRLSSGYYRIVAGERRWRASRQAGLSEIPAMIVEVDEQGAAERALVENLQREDLNAIEEAEGFRALIEVYGLTQEEAADRVGKSRPAVTNTLRLLTLPASVQALVSRGRLSAGHARALVPVKPSSAQEKLARRCVEGELSVRQLEALVKGEMIEKPEKPQATGVNYVAEVETRLTRALGRKVKLVTGRKKGRFELEYYGEDDRELLIETLEKLGGQK